MQMNCSALQLFQYFLFVVLWRAGQSLHSKQYCSIDTAALVYVALTIADNCESPNKRIGGFSLSLSGWLVLPHTADIIIRILTFSFRKELQKKAKQILIGVVMSASKVNHQFAKLLDVYFNAFAFKRHECF